MAGTQSDKGRRDFLKRTAGICAVTAEGAGAEFFAWGMDRCREKYERGAVCDGNPRIT